MFLCTFQLYIFTSSYRTMLMTSHPGTQCQWLHCDGGSKVLLWTCVDPLLIHPGQGFAQFHQGVGCRPPEVNEPCSSHSYSTTGKFFRDPYLEMCWSGWLRWLWKWVLYKPIAQVPVLPITAKGHLPKSILCGMPFVVTLIYWSIFSDMVSLVTPKPCREQNGSQNYFVKPNECILSDLLLLGCLGPRYWWDSLIFPSRPMEK